MSKVLTPILLFIISIGLFFSYLKPAWGALQEYNNLKMTLTEAIDHYTQLDEKVNALEEKQQRTIDNYGEDLLRILPDTVSTVRFLIDIDALTKQHNMTITSFDLPRQDVQLTMKTEQGGNEVKSMTISAELQGEYADFKDFLRAIESSKTLTDVTTIGIEKVTNETGTGYTLMYAVTMKLYWLS
jgi:Tfp pilus assembly protein PilO